MVRSAPPDDDLTADEDQNARDDGPEQVHMPRPPVLVMLDQVGTSSPLPEDVRQPRVVVVDRGAVGVVGPDRSGARLRRLGGLVDQRLSLDFALRLVVPEYLPLRVGFDLIVVQVPGRQPVGPTDGMDADDDRDELPRLV